MRRALTIATILALGLSAQAQGADFPLHDPMGPLSDVTKRWRHFQPAGKFCIRPNAPHFTPGGTGATATGRDRACRRSGFPRSAKGLYQVKIQTPELCDDCRRLFIDFSKIKPGSGLNATAQGHVYYHLFSVNPTYTVEATAHSPNTKNFHNDKLLTPDGSPQQPLIGLYEMHAISYVTSTGKFVHNAAQGPYYVGPWYVNRDRERIRGVYLDLNLAQAIELPIAQLNTVGYLAGFYSGGLCRPVDNSDLLYVGCVDWFGGSATQVDPWAG